MICEYCDGEGFVTHEDVFDVEDGELYVLLQTQAAKGYETLVMCPECDGYGQISEIPYDVIERIEKFNRRTGFSRLYHLKPTGRTSRLIIEFAWRGKRIFEIPLWNTRDIYRD